MIMLTKSALLRFGLPLLLLMLGGCEMNSDNEQSSSTVSDSGFESMPVGVRVEKAPTLNARPQVGGVMLSWESVPNAERYAIYWQAENERGRSVAKPVVNSRTRCSGELPDAASSKAVPENVGFGTLRFETADNATSYYHQGVAIGRIHYYRVAAIYANGEESDVCEPVAVIPALAMKSQPSDGAP